MHAALEGHLPGHSSISVGQRVSVRQSWPTILQKSCCHSIGLSLKNGGPTRDYISQNPLHLGGATGLVSLMEGERVDICQFWAKVVKKSVCLLSLSPLLAGTRDTKAIRDRRMNRYEKTGPLYHYVEESCHCPGISILDYNSKIFLLC